MSIRCRNGRYQVRVSTGAGRRIEVTLPKGATARDAKQKEAQVIRAQIDVSCGIRPKILIDDALDRWEESEACLLRSYRKDLSYRIAVLREHFTAGKYMDDLEALAERVKKVGNKAGAKPATTNRLLAILRRIGRLNKAGAEIRLLPGEIARHVYLTVQQVEKLLAHSDPRLARFIRFACLSGMRRGEILQLQPGDIGNRSASVTRSKSGRPRTVPLPDEAIGIISECLPWDLTASNVNRLFRAARKAAGLPHVRLHDLRHTYASWLIQAGMGLAPVRDLLGHSNIAVTSRYTHLSVAHLQSAVERLPRLGGSDLGQSELKEAA